MALTRPTWATNTIQSLANKVTGQATQLKINFDKAANDIKTFISTMCAEIESQFATKSEVQGVVLGQIPEGTITTLKLSTDLQTTINRSTRATKIYNYKNSGGAL